MVLKFSLNLSKLLKNNDSIRCIFANRSAYVNCNIIHRIIKVGTFSMILIIVLELAVLNLIPINGKIINVNMTYGPQGKFVSEMVMLPKKEYQEFRDEYHKMEDDNLELVKQISGLRDKPLSYYENEARKLENEDLILNQNIEMTRKAKKSKFKATNPSQTMKSVTNIPKLELNTTIFVKDAETTTSTSKLEFKTTIPIPVVEMKTNHIRNRLKTTTKFDQFIKNTIIFVDIETTTSSSKPSKAEFKRTSPIPATEMIKTHTRNEFNTTKFNLITKTTTNNINQESNTSVDVNLKLKEANMLNRALQKEIKNLTQERNETNKYLFHFKWKMVVIQTVDDHENDFDQLELRNVRPPFQLNRTLINETLESWKFDRLAEQRRQRWVFYLKTSPYCDNNFEHLAKRIASSKFTVEEFCRSLAELYKLITFDSHLETVKPAKLTVGTLAHFKKYHFVISMLLEDYPKTELIENIFKEVKS